MAGDRQQARRGSRRRGNKVTVAQVAAQAGVSLMTVSRVINGHPSVAEETRKRVQAVVRELGYTPNPAARSLASGRQCRIGLVYDNPSASFLSQLMMGALSEAGALDAQLVVERCDSDHAADDLVKRLERHRLDAVILPPPMGEDSRIVAALRASGAQVALVAIGRPNPAAHAITIDEEAAAFAITRRLIGQGHRRIGHIAGNIHHSGSRLRERGYRRALEEAGLGVDPMLTVEGDYEYRSGLAGAETLLDLPEPPTAIFSANDDMAAAAMAVAHRRGLDVPRDLSICGFDDTGIATIIWPALTTIRQPVADMGRVAVRLLVEAVLRESGGGAPEHRVLDFALVARGSDGAARGT